MAVTARVQEHVSREESDRQGAILEEVLTSHSGCKAHAEASGWSMRFFVALLQQCILGFEENSLETLDFTWLHCMTVAPSCRLVKLST